MARARNIKPSFFDNDQLAELDPLARLLFIGMWTIADFKGDFEWREKRVKAKLLPYDNCDIKELAINLDKSGFIRFYSDGDKMYCRVVNFHTHQNPHKNEKLKGSDIPEYSESLRQVIDLTTITINRDKNGTSRDLNETNPADSLNLIPDSLNPKREGSPSAPRSKRFKKPSVDEIQIYCDERNNGINAERFYDFYESKGWMVGKTKMKCWKASVRTWEQRNNGTTNGGSHNEPDFDSTNW